MKGLVSKLERLKHWQVVLLLSVFIAISFGQSVFNGYSLDDYLGPNHQLVSEGFGGISKAFTRPMDESNDESYGYRPISIIAFILERQLFGSSPAVGHVINLLLYVLLAFLVYRLLLSLGVLSRVYSLLVTLVFSLHSLHSEVVLSLKNRDELLSALFGILAFLLILKWQHSKKGRWFLLGIIAFTIAMLAKVSVAPFFLIIAASLYILKKASLKKSVLVAVVLFLAGGLRVVLIHFFMDQNLGRELGIVENPLAAGGSFSETLTAIGSSFAFCVQKLILPYPLSSYYGKGTIHVDGLNIESVMGLLLLALSISLIGFRIIKGRRDVFTWALLGLVATLLPFLNWPLLVPGIVAERLAFLSVLFFSVLLVGLLAIKFSTSGIIAICGVFIMFFTYQNIQRTQHWKSQVSLLEEDSHRHPNSIHLHYLLGKEYMTILYDQAKAGNVDSKLARSAKMEFETVQNSYSEKRAEISNALGTVHASFLSDAKTAHQNFKVATEFDPSNEAYWYNRAKTAVQLGLLNDGLKSYQELNTLQPSNFSYHAELSDLLLKENRPNDAYLLNKEALTKFLNREENIRIFLGVSSAMMNNHEEAIWHFETALSFNPDNKALAEKINELRLTLKSE